MISQAAAERLVTSYIRGWHERWAGVRERFAKDVDFKLWASLIAELDRAHFIEGESTGGSGSYGYPPDHDPEKSTIVGFTSDGERGARVETRTEHIVPSYWEFQVVLAGDEPRLRKISRFFAPKGTPVVAPARAEQLLATPSETAALGPLPRGIDPNGDALFIDGREGTLWGAQHSVSVRTLGDLVTKTGVLSVRDFGYDAHRLAPFERRVPPGRYPTDVAIVGNRIAALRRRFSDAPAASWHPATFAGGGGHGAGVDAGNVALFDVGSFVVLDEWEKERLFQEHVVESEHPTARLIRLREEGDCAIVESGGGDGVYPCYWGADERHQVVRLFVDFMLLGTALEETARIDWTGGPIEHPLLSSWGVEMAIDGRFLVVRDGEGAFTRALLQPGAEEPLHSDRVGVCYTGDERRHDFLRPLEPPLTIDVTLGTGYRNV